jgi:peptide deformylase
MLSWHAGRVLPVNLKIVQVGDPVLREAARAVTIEELRGPEIQQLIEWMRETMRDAPGVGLAAPQVSVPLQIAVIEDRAELMASIAPERLAERGRRPVPFHVIVNPAISIEGEPVEFFEGCLSLAGFAALVPRAPRVRVECWNERGEPVSIAADGWYARILQHEIDHLAGTLYIDRMQARSFSTIENHKRHWDGLSLEELRSILVPR